MPEPIIEPTTSAVASMRVMALTKWMGGPASLTVCSRMRFASPSVPPPPTRRRRCVESLAQASANVLAADENACAERLRSANRRGTAEFTRAIALSVAQRTVNIPFALIPVPSDAGTRRIRRRYPPSGSSPHVRALFATLCVIGAAIALWDEPPQSLPLLGIVGAIGAFAVFDRVRTARGQTVGQRDVALQLAIDVLALTALLYFSGGWTNPLVSLYLVPIAIAAAVLPAALAWAVMLAALLGYAIVAIDYVPHSRSRGDVHVARPRHVADVRRCSGTRSRISAPRWRQRCERVRRR